MRWLVAGAEANTERAALLRLTGGRTHVQLRYAAGCRLPFARGRHAALRRLLLAPPQRVLSVLRRHVLLKAQRRCLGRARILSGRGCQSLRQRGGQRRQPVHASGLDLHDRVLLRLVLRGRPMQLRAHRRRKSARTAYRVRWVWQMRGRLSFPGAAARIPGWIWRLRLPRGWRDQRYRVVIVRHERWLGARPVRRNGRRRNGGRHRDR